MSLVVARRVGESLCIVSDTALVDPYAGKLPLAQGMLKITIVNQQLCVGWPGHQIVPMLLSDR